jgi:hypothetical protein
VNSLRDTIAFNSGVKKRQQMINENTDSSKKEMIVMRRVLDIVTNFISQVEDLKMDLNNPMANRMYGGPMQAGSEPTITPEEMVSIKKKAYELFLAKMKVADEVVHATFGMKHEEKEEAKAEEKEEEDGEEW